MKSVPLVLVVLVAMIVPLQLCAFTGAFPSRGALLSPEQVDAPKLRSLVEQGAEALVVVLSEDQSRREYARIQRQAADAGLELYGWIEVARNPELARAHPEWMASLGMHQAWRQRFPDAPEAKEGTVSKAFPWVPIWYAEAYQFHLDRIDRLLEKAPPELAGVFLNNIQSGPSSCGCGNDQCRWAIDYRVPSTATKLEAPDTPARFVAEVRQRLPGRPVIPVWMIECEAIDQHDHDHATGYCGRVICFDGRCWPEYARQLAPLADGSADPIAVPAFWKALDRDLPAYGPPAGWILAAVRTFQDLPDLSRGEANPVAPDRLVVIVQGWDVSQDEIDAQLRRTREAGVPGAVVALTPIDQSWEPQQVPVPEP